jgi:hypothetical protein
MLQCWKSISIGQSQPGLHHTSCALTLTSQAGSPEPPSSKRRVLGGSRRLSSPSCGVPVPSSGGRMAATRWFPYTQPPSSPVAKGSSCTSLHVWAQQTHALSRVVGHSAAAKHAEQTNAKTHR